MPWDEPRWHLDDHRWCGGRFFATLRKKVLGEDGIDRRLSSASVGHEIVFRVEIDPIALHAVVVEGCCDDFQEVSTSAIWHEQVVFEQVEWCLFLSFHVGGWLRSTSSDWHKHIINVKLRTSESLNGNFDRVVFVTVKAPLDRKDLVHDFLTTLFRA